VSDKRERSPWHGRQGGSGQRAQPERNAAWEYLANARGAEIADEVRFHARIGVGVCTRSHGGLTARERKRAHTLALELERLARRASAGHDDFIPDLLKGLANAYGTPLTTRRGRRRGPSAWFVWSMLRFGAGELAALGHQQLRPMELIAAACEGGLPDVAWKDRAELLDHWRKLAKDNAPAASERPKLLAEAKEKLAKEEAEREAERKRSAARDRDMRRRAFAEAVSQMWPTEEARPFWLDWQTREVDEVLDFMDARAEQAE
jgi:hypothetical protein